MSALTNDLIDAVGAANRGQRRCTVCELLPTLTAEEAVSLREALNSKLGAKRLSLILRKNGIEVGVPSIHAHRQGEHDK